MMTKLLAFLMFTSSVPTGILAAKAENPIVSITALLATVVTIVVGCLITLFFTHLSRHADFVEELRDVIDKKLELVVTEKLCEARIKGVKKDLCKIIKHLGVKEDEESDEQT